MRIGIIADPHGNSFGLAAALESLSKVGVDLTVCAGDIVGYYPFVNETIDLLRTSEVVCIAGNHDACFRGSLPSTPDQQRSYNLDYVRRVITNENSRWLDELPDRYAFEVQGRTFLVCHGSPWSAEEYVYPDSRNFNRFETVPSQVIIMGHTHIPLIRKEGTKVLINPGSCGQPRDYDPRASFAWIDTDSLTAEIDRVSYDISSLQRRCEELGFAPTLTDILVRTR
jgi:putative phosphoesterase